MKILIIQNRMGIGDTVIFLPYIKAISKKFNSPVTLLVKQNCKAEQFLYQTNYIDKIIFLKRGRNKNERHDGIIGALMLANDLRKYKFEKVFIFNSSLRYNLISRFAGIKEIYQYPLFKKTNQHITKPAINLIKENFNSEIESSPQIQIESILIKKAISEFNIDKNKKNILLGIGGSGPTKRIPSKTFLSVIKKICEIKDSIFFLATGKNKDEQIILNEILNSNYKNRCIPLDHLSIKETLPLIKNCDISICNDSSFAHLSSALGVKTITLMADTPLIYGSYSSNMYPIIPDGESTVSHNTFGKNRISSKKIFDKFISLID